MMEAFADIEGPVRIGLLQLALWWGAGVIAAFLVACLLVRFLRRRTSRDAGPATPLRSPLEIAMERLQQLRNNPASLPAEPFTVEVSDIIRRFLEAALKIPAREQTSEEFLLTVQSNPDLPGTLRQHMPAFLEQCDRVKFARQSLAGEQRERLLETAGTVLESTDAHLREAAAEEKSVAENA